jgi:1,4-alpha-glucan branching enzyme
LSLDQSRIDDITQGRESDPFAVLGVHLVGKTLTARAFIPGAEGVEAFTTDGKPAGALTQIDDAGLFEARLTIRKPKPLRYRARTANAEWWVNDAYSYGPVLGPMDDHFIAEGSHLRLFDKLGAHVIDHEGASGTHFAVWAPNARRVAVVGDFNDWDGRIHAMRRRGDTGMWEIFVPGVEPGCAYKFQITSASGVVLPLKADPFAFQSELRPATASIVARPAEHVWGDAAHRAFWSQADARREAISTYEVHAGSWRRRIDGSFLSWDELASQLIPYVVDMGFTHIEFLPISEHPYDPSWGYQTTGLYAPTARFGEPEGFARFVDGAHRAGIGVILDWVPAHFPTDEHGLATFDGTALYEHADPRKGFHPDWQTAIYNFGRREVTEYLVNNALFWAEKYHLDGLRVDAVASMLYLDYSRAEGQWLPNDQGGRENLEAVAFLQRMNAALYGTHAGVMTIAEESTSWPKVSHPVHTGGLGFGFKWNMGFMHDTLRYLARDPVHRSFHHDDVTFGLLYAFSENFVLALSHDEVVHGKGTLLQKMAGDDAQKFATLRAYYAFIWAYPGKKLLFMGQEFAQRREWDENRALDWDLIDDARHRGVRLLIRELNHVYAAKPALHARDCEGEGFAWLLADQKDDCVFAWVRMAPDAQPIVMVCNFSTKLYVDYAVPLPKAGSWREIINSNSDIYGGSGIGNLGRVETGSDGTALLALPPLTTIWLEYE